MAGIGTAPGGAVLAEDVRDFQQWPGHAAGLSARWLALLPWPPLRRAGRLAERACDRRDAARGDAGVARRGVQLVVAERPRVIMLFCLCH